MKHFRMGWLVLGAFTLLGCNDGSGLPLGGDASGAADNSADSTHFSATITRTSMGIPHIKADNFAGLGYGYGYAFAKDNLCTMQQDYITIRGERAKYFGRDGSYTIYAGGVTLDNVNSDFFWKFMATDAVVAHLKETALPEIREMSRGYVAGYNRYIHELKAGEHPGRHQACADQPWLTDITLADMYRRYFRLSILASGSAVSSYILAATPPALSLAASKAAGKQRKSLPLKRKLALLQQHPGALQALADHEGYASNMYAFGKDYTETGVPILFGNPHFPWLGTERFYLSHATIPDKMNIMGVSLYGVPAILIGFNDHFAWSHTVSTARRFTFYQLTLNPLNPMQYLYDGKWRDIKAYPVTIQVKEEDGSLTEQSHTFYRSHYGPMFAINVSGLPVLGWTNLLAYTVRDANAENDRMLNQFALWDQAKSLDEFIALHKSVLGIPWVNTVAAAPGEQVYYGDISVVPNVSRAKENNCSVPIALVVKLLVPGLPTLDGTRSACEWGTDEDAPVPGIFGASNLPTLKRDDYVGNFNDSYWLTNPAEPLTGFAPIIGDEGTPRSLRTRLANIQVKQFIDSGKKFTMHSVEDMVLSSRIYSAELALKAVTDAYCPLGVALSTSGLLVDISQACAVLKNWDGTDNLDSVGGHIWREFWRNLAQGVLGLPVSLPVSIPAVNNLIWLAPFSASNAVNTPNTLNTILPTIQIAFGDAVKRIQDLGIPMDAPLGSLQHPCCIDATPVFGGEGFEGAFTVVDTYPLTKEGYGIYYGNSYIQTVTWDDDGVKADAFLTYSESTDPANPHFSDFTHAYSQKQWVRLPFHPDEIKADTQSVLELSQ